MGFDKRLLVALVASASLLVASGARAQTPSAADKESARALMDTGDEKSDAKDYAAALKAYQAADALVHFPMTGLAVARVQERLGQLLEARDAAIQVTHSTQNK